MQSQCIGKKNEQTFKVKTLKNNMIKKKRCPNCSEKIKESYTFCPSCGIQLKETSDDWGMIGKNDKKEKNIEPAIIGGLGNGIMNKMLGSAFRMLEKEMQRELLLTSIFY